MPKDRIREIRKSLKLSQTAFGEALGVSRDVINNLEQGRVEPSDLIINMMCARFDIDEQWLRTGVGTMHREKSRDEEIAEWAASLGDVGNEFKRRFVYALTKLNEDGWEVIERFAQTLYDEQMAENEQTKKDEGK